jgi:hypothetical protein
VHWTTPQRLGGGGVPGYSISGGNSISAAHGVLAATFNETSNAACEYFVGAAAPCAVFQTTRNAGRTWTRHLLPVPSNSTGTLWVAADPSRAGHFTVAVLNSTSTEFLVYQSWNWGRTWCGPTIVTENATTVHFKPWINYSAQGVLGLMWPAPASSSLGSTTHQTGSWGWRGEAPT